MVTALVPRSSGPGSSPGRGHYVVLLGKTLYSHSNLRSYPPSLYLDEGKEGMIHLLVGSYVQKPDSGFFSDWSRNNTYDLLSSDWLSYFNETSGQKLVRSRNGADEALASFFRGRLFFCVS